MQADRCETCRFWHQPPAFTKDIGECRRNPPVPDPLHAALVALRVYRTADLAGEFHASASKELELVENYGRETGDVFGTWPVIGGDEWCGEHRPREPHVVTGPGSELHQGSTGS